MMTYTFDTLPVRPQPQYLETFCSYSLRLAAANGFENLSHWWLLCYSTGKPQVTSHTGDATPISFGQLPDLAGCSEQSLQNTTFYHLVRKFGFRPHPQPSNTFLMGSVASYLRYCPQCLAEQNYYRLTWRFLMLSGCPKHGCEFRHSCGHCERPIPLMPRKPGVGQCPYCGKPLSQGHSQSLDEQTWLKAQARERDLTYLLKPHLTETAAETLKKQLGKQFVYKRLSRQLKVARVARELGCLPVTLHALENPSPQTGGGKLHTYVAYADYLDLDFQTMLEAPLPAETYEDILAHRLEQIMDELAQAGQWADRKALAHRLGLHESVMNRYPKLLALWDDFRTRRQQARYTALETQIRQLAAQIDAEGLRVSISEIARRMGRSTSDMLQYPQTEAALRDVTGLEAQLRYEARREEQLLGQVKAAVAALEARDERVSKTVISRETGISFPAFDSRPRIKAYLDELLAHKTEEHWERQRQQRDTKWLLRVQQGVETLKARGEPITVSAICQIVNKSEHGLRSNPSVDAFIKQAVADYQVQQRQQREADLLAEVKQAAESLRANGQTVTVQAICQTIQKGVNGLKLYVSVEAFLKQVVAANKQTRTGK